MEDPLTHLRREYRAASLDEAEAAPEPLVQFRQWFAQARAAEVDEPNAMTLATVAIDGAPRARVVLLKAVDEAGFVFFTNYDSDKGRELDGFPRAALVFLWLPLERQVRVEGRVERVSAEESDAYFELRPRESQLGASASPQSRVVADRATLERAFAEATARYDGAAVPRPAGWGGYRVIPTTVEFWQGRPSRLHDRLRYRCDDAGRWMLERLAP
jgi:pyridoxamine 5'-phosphate oxidase